MTASPTSVPSPARPVPRQVFPIRMYPAAIAAVRAAAKAENINASEWMRRAAADRLARQQDPSPARSSS